MSTDKRDILEVLAQTGHIPVMNACSPTSFPEAAKTKRSPVTTFPEPTWRNCRQHGTAVYAGRVRRGDKKLAERYDPPDRG
jgi:hypothetical protein